MVKTIAQHLIFVRRALQVVAEVDIFMAKAKLGRLLQGIIPDVEGDGAVRVVSAKHPVLLLRSVQPVPNTFELSVSSQALVISGPNAGGKTVILKMAGMSYTISLLLLTRNNF